ncbi:MAG: hypothetical protein ABIW80_07615 [Lapillicoccus sp.]
MTASLTPLDAHLGARPTRPTVPLAELRRTVRRYALNPNLAALLPETGKSPQPSAARLAGDARTDVWLISWPEGSQTGWHDHGDAAGAFAVASGAVEELTWALGTVQHRRLTWGSPHGVGEGDSRAFGRDHVHNVVGAGPGRTLTVHAYAPGLVSMGEFELAAEGPVRLATNRGDADGGSW